ncbi:cell division protein FtsQ/DivIB, partial [Lactobacillus jensenii]
IARQKLTKMQIDKSITIFVSYSNKSSLFTDLKALKSIPTKLRNQISIINGRSIRKNKIVLLMKDGNIIIGNTDTIAQKIKYYPKIKSTLNNKSVIDLEIGAFSYPLTDNEKNNLGF